jgi:hypothetical protein
MPGRQKKRVSVIITEYWEISHADVIVSKMLEGFTLDGRTYTSSLDIVSMYVDHFPANDLSRELCARHHINLHTSIRNALLNGKTAFDLDGIILIGEHGDYPINQYGQILFPRRRFFAECLQVMLEFDRIVPIYSDKAFAVVKKDILWLYRQIKKYHLPFYSSSLLPLARQYPDFAAPPAGSPICKILGFECYGGYYAVHPAVDYSQYRIFEHGVDYANYHRMEMIQSIVEQRACGETGVDCVRAYEGAEALEKLFSRQWQALGESLAGFINLPDLATVAEHLTRPIFFEVDYMDGLALGLLCTDQEITENVCAHQTGEGAAPHCTQFILQSRKPYVDFGRLALQIERFIHTSKPPFPVERSLITAGTSDALMRALKLKKEIKTPYLHVTY